MTPSVTVTNSQFLWVQTQGGLLGGSVAAAPRSHCSSTPTVLLSTLCLMSVEQEVDLLLDSEVSREILCLRQDVAPWLWSRTRGPYTVSTTHNPTAMTLSATGSSTPPRVTLSSLTLMTLTWSIRMTATVLCGRNVPPPVLSYDNVMVLQFTSDGTVTYRGFHATVSFISKIDLLDGDSEDDTVHYSHSLPDSCGMPHVRAALTPSESLEGQGASRHAWPWDVRLSMDTKIICYGAIIQPAWVLTAAHCLLGLPEQSLRSLSVETGGPKNQRQDVRRIVLHPQYDPSSQDYDVALLQLDSLLLITEHAQSVCLPCSGQEVPASQVCMLSSWEGQTGGPWNSTVEPLEVPLVSRADCERYNTGRLTPRMLCAGPPQPHGQDTCTGPGGSGGALVCQTEDSGYFILGVSIQKEGCGKFQRPGVYTSVPMLRDWIQEQLHEDSADSSRTMPYQEQQEEQAFSIDYDDNNYGAESSGESC